MRSSEDSAPQASAFIIMCRTIVWCVSWFTKIVPANKTNSPDVERTIKGTVDICDTTGRDTLRLCHHTRKHCTAVQEADIIPAAVSKRYNSRPPNAFRFTDVAIAPPSQCLGVTNDATPTQSVYSIDRTSMPYSVFTSSCVLLHFLHT